MLKFLFRENNRTGFTIEQLQVSRQQPLTVNHQPQRMFAGPVPDCQLRVVNLGSTSTYQDSLFFTSPFMYQLPFQSTSAVKPTLNFGSLRIRDLATSSSQLAAQPL